MRTTNDVCVILFFLLAFVLLPSTVGAQAAQGTQGTQESGGGSEPATAAAAAPASQGADTEELNGELVGAIRNESATNVAEAFRYGAEGFRRWDKAKVEATLEMIHEQYGNPPIIDEARLAVSKALGRGVEIGVTGWRDLTIDARSRVVGPELAMQGPIGLELTAGAYFGNINIEESWGRFVMARAQVERVLGELELLANFERGRIHSDGESGFLGEGFYHKYEAQGVVPFTMIPGLRRVPGSIAVSVEIKQTNFGGEGPKDHEITKILGYEFPLTGVATKVANALRH